MVDGRPAVVLFILPRLVGRPRGQAASRTRHRAGCAKRRYSGTCRPVDGAVQSAPTRRAPRTWKSGHVSTAAMAAAPARDAVIEAPAAGRLRAARPAPPPCCWPPPAMVERRVVRTWPTG